MGRERSRRTALIANGEIGLTGMKVDYGVGADDLERDVGMDLAPQWQARYQPAMREGVSRGHPQRWRPVRLTSDPRYCRCEAVEPLIDHGV
jgi:hypothetical protein